MNFLSARQQNFIHELQDTCILEQKILTLQQYLQFFWEYCVFEPLMRKGKLKHYLYFSIYNSFF